MTNLVSMNRYDLSLSDISFVFAHMRIETWLGIRRWRECWSTRKSNLLALTPPSTKMMIRNVSNNICCFLNARTIPRTTRLYQYKGAILWKKKERKEKEAFHLLMYFSRKIPVLKTLNGNVMIIGLQLNSTTDFSNVKPLAPYFILLFPQKASHVDGEPENIYISISF